MGTIFDNPILSAMLERNLLNEQIDHVLANNFRPFGTKIVSQQTNSEDDLTTMRLIQLMYKIRISDSFLKDLDRLLKKR